MAATALRVQLPKAHWHVAHPSAVVSDPHASSSVGAKCAQVTTFACFCVLTPPISVCCTFLGSSRGRARACVIATRTMQITPTRTKCECAAFTRCTHSNVDVFYSRWPGMRCGGKSSMECAREGVWCAKNNGAALSRLFEPRCIMNYLRFVCCKFMGQHAAYVYLK